MAKRAGMTLIVLMVLICTILTGNAFLHINVNSDSSFLQKMQESYIDSMPYKERLSSLITSLQYMTGIRYFDGIYIGDDGSLLKDINVPSTRNLATAKNYIMAMAEKSHNTYFCLIPTASVIKQQEIEGYVAEKLVNQRQIMNEMYSSLYGSTKTVDVYQTLFSRRNEYIYYHTEDMPTGLGGYYIYRELGNRMGNLSKDLSSFSTIFRQHNFYGSLSNDIIQKYASSDFVSLYENIQSEHQYKVAHIDENGKTTIQDGLFLPDEEELENKTDMILGGLSPITVISNENKGGNTLLVFTDESAKSWLPFMAENYDYIKVVDLDKAPEKELRKIDISKFDDILFSYSMNHFTEGIDFTKLDFVTG